MEAKMADVTLETLGHQLELMRAELRGELASVRAELAPMRAQLDGLPLISRALVALQQDTRSIKAAFNDFALTNPTKGEIEALHADVNRVQAENAEMGTRLATLERLMAEMRRDK
jgi:Tfp pilus assembly protein PilO